VTIEFIGSEKNIIGGYIFNVTCHDCLRTDNLEEEKMETPPRYLGAGLELRGANGVAIVHEKEYQGEHKIRITAVPRGGIKEFRVSL